MPTIRAQLMLAVALGAAVLAAPSASAGSDDRLATAPGPVAPPGVVASRLVGPAKLMTDVDDVVPAADGGWILVGTAERTRTSSGRRRIVSTDVAVVVVTGAGIVRRTIFIGGSGLDRPMAAALDSRGGLHVTGFTDSHDFPRVHADAGFNATRRKDFSDAFVFSLDVKTRRLRYSTYLGGGYTDVGRNLIADADGTVTVVGETMGDGFPLRKPMGPTTVLTGTHTGFLASYAADGRRLRSSFLGSGNFSDVWAITRGPDAHSIYLGGQVFGMRPRRARPDGMSVGAQPGSATRGTSRRLRMRRSRPTVAGSQTASS